MTAADVLVHMGEAVVLGLFAWSLRTQLEVSKVVAVIKAGHDGLARDVDDHEDRLRDLERQRA